MGNNEYLEYNKAYQKANRVIEELYNQHRFEEEAAIRNIIYSGYKQRKLDPDGRAIRTEFGIKCTADGLHSIWRICNMEMKVEDIVSVYKRYRKEPIFFFPSENGGINTSRAKIFGDRIDHALFDLKMYYTKKRSSCRLLNAYNRPKTKVWLESMQSFENIVDWWGVKGIFTDSEYNVYDLEYGDNRILEEWYASGDYQHQWSKDYYQHLKEEVDMYNAV